MMMVWSVVLLLPSVTMGFLVGSNARSSTRLRSFVLDDVVMEEKTTTEALSSSVFEKNEQDEVWMPSVTSRPRRNRKSAGMRAMVRETHLSAANLMQPIFIHDEDSVDAIASMPGQSRHSIKSLVEQVLDGWAYGVKSFVLFPKVAESLKSNYGEEAYNEDGLVQRAVRAIKEACPEATVVTDIALDPYSSEGHDGVVLESKIVNDLTVSQLCKQALSHARAGADCVAPSDMMDGRIGAIRSTLDKAGYTDVSIIAYTAKYASAFYGPFRDALDSHPGFGDKKTYQQDPANAKESLRECALDLQEGADMLMVKPGMPYLDIIYRLKEQSNGVPVAAYHVSGEYAMLKAAALQGWVNEKALALETLMCFRRAGADVILTYYATQAAKWLKEDDA